MERIANLADHDAFHLEMARDVWMEASSNDDSDKNTYECDAHEETR